MVAAEREAIARSLGPDELPPRSAATRSASWRSSQHPTRATPWPARPAHPLRRVRDQDSSVRAALIDTARAAAAAFEVSPTRGGR